MQALFQSTQHIYEKRQGSGSGYVPLTNGSGSGSGRPQNMDPHPVPDHPDPQHCLEEVARPVPHWLEQVVRYAPYWLEQVVRSAPLLAGTGGQMPGCSNQVQGFIGCRCQLQYSPWKYYVCCVQ